VPGTLGVPARAELTQLLTEDDVLFTRYTIAR
jgi:hypothetical protein